MNPLTKSEVNEIIKTNKAYAHFTAERKAAFLNIWKNRLHDAIHIHKSNDLEKLALNVIAFAERTPHENLSHYACYSKSAGAVGFLYDNISGEFLQIGERKPIR